MNENIFTNAADANTRESIFKMPKGKVESRWFTFENVNGEKGKGGMSGHGRKGSAAADIKAGETLVLAHVTGSGTVRRMWATLGEREVNALRGLKIDFFGMVAKLQQYKLLLDTSFATN